MGAGFCSQYHEIHYIKVRYIEVFHDFQLAVSICTKQKSKHTIFLLLLWFKNSCTSIWIYLTLKDAINSILFPCNNRFDFTLVLVEKETLLVVH